MIIGKLSGRAASLGVNIVGLFDRRALRAGVLCGCVLTEPSTFWGVLPGRFNKSFDLLRSNRSGNNELLQESFDANPP